MSYHFKKRDFSILIEPKLEQNSENITVNVSRNKFQERIILTLISNGLYVYNDSEWKLLDTNKIIDTHRQNNYFNDNEKLIVALVISINKLPIGNNYLQLTNKESNILEVVIYNLIRKENINWLPKSKINYFNGDNMILHINRELIIYPTPTMSFTMISADTPKLMISPSANQLTNPISVPFEVPTKMIQKGKKLVSKTENTGLGSDFYEMAKRRGEWKRLHPNWAEEIYPNRHEPSVTTTKNEQINNQNIVPTMIDGENTLTENKTPDQTPDQSNVETIDEQTIINEENTLTEDDDNNLSLDENNIDDDFVGVLTGPEEPIYESFQTY